MERSKSKKIALLISGIIGLLAFALLIIQEVKINGLESALVNLIDTRTEGEYELAIGSADFDLRSLTYRLKDIEIIRTGISTHPGGVQSINIPFIEAKLGTFLSFFSSPRLTFEEVMVSEPAFVIDSRVREKNKVTIGQALVTVFPAVESVLSHFEIQSLRIERGKLTVEQPGDHPIHLRRIDLLVQNWNSSNSAREGEIRLNIASQEVELSQASFSFGEMEYKYSGHYLTFSDFTLHSLDTATSSQIDVQGKSVVIKDLDYQELYTNQRYKLGKIEITEPRFSGALRARTDAERDQKIHLPLAEILRQTFGEIQLDTATIANAAFQMTLTVDQDSIKANIPQVNIDLHDLALVEGSSEIRFGDLQMDLSETEISVNDNVRLVCNAMLFERNEDLTISNIRLTDVLNNETFAACERIGFRNFRIFEFLVGRELRADSIAITNADVTLTQVFLDLFPNFSGRGQKHNTMGVAIDELSLQDVDLSYTNNILHLALSDVSTRVNNIRDLSWTYLLEQLKAIDLGSLSYAHKTHDLRTELRSIRLTPGSAAIKHADLSYGSLMVRASDLIAARSVPYVGGEDHTNWKSITFGNLIVEGPLPENQKPIAVDNLIIHSLMANIMLNEKKVALTAKDLHARDVSTSGTTSLGELSGRLYQVGISSSPVMVSVDSILLNTNETSGLYNVIINTSNGRNAIPYAEATRLTWKANEKLLRHFFARNIRLSENGVTSLVADSLQLDGINLDKNFAPSAEMATVYEPVFSTSTRASTLSGHSFTEMILNFTLHGGRIDIENQHITLEGVTTGQPGPNLSLTTNRIIFDTPRQHIALDAVRFDGGDVQGAGITIQPRVGDEEEVEYETDVIAGSSKDFRIIGLVVDSLIQKQKIIADTLFVNRPMFDVKRDRRLPDPEPTEKPFSLGELLSGKGLEAGVINLRDGIIRYTEVSEKSGEEGTIAFHRVDADIRQEQEGKGYAFTANAYLYDKAPVHVNYQYLDSSSFKIAARIGPLDLTTMNQVLTPLQGMELKSGNLEEFQFEAIATRDSASGNALMTYSDLHMALLKRADEPDKKNLGNEIITFLANGMLRHKRYKASSPVLETRIREKSMFNYWKRIAANGAIQVVRKGKTAKK